MSHVSTISLEVTDLSALEAASKLCGLEMVKQSTFRWFGEWVNDYDAADAAYRHGIKPENYGKCDYVLRIPGNDKAYEVGVVKRTDGKPGYALVFDFFAGGYGLMDAIEKNGSKLKREYAIAVGMKRMSRAGFRTERVINPATNKPRMRAWR